MTIQPDIGQERLCLICGEPSTQVFGGSEILPLCHLPSCEAALIDEINAELNVAAAEAAKE